MSKDKLHSYHVFLFPFAWEYTNTQPNSSFEEKTKLEDFVKKLKELKWQSEQFKPDTLLKYNEFNYFYDFARDVLYDQGNNANIIAHLYHSSFQKEEKEYRFEVKWESNEKFITKEYKLKIDSILLHLYSTGVGVLSIHLMNRADDQGEEDDILRINQYGRRIFPPFYDVPTELIGDQQQFEEKDWHNAISRTKEKVLPCWIELENGNKNKEDFLSNHGKGFQLPKFFEHLFGDKLFTANKSQNEGLIHLSPVLDDRMFVVCWYGNDGTATRLNPTKKQVKNLSLFNADEFWYKYVFVDGGMKTCQNDELSKTILESSTNDRWAKFGTFYGVS
ncbi:MAG TPA: hypothetical protein PKC40_09245, partial [Saprospiraceae bacterium]|nr:hypothetical protein [Saprospiraceae bacterium]